VSIAAAGLGLFLSQPAVADTCSRKDCQPKANYVDAEEVRLFGCCPEQAEQGPASQTSRDAAGAHACMHASSLSCTHEASTRDATTLSRCIHVHGMDTRRMNANGDVAARAYPSEW
jgi:hypothetical protein